MRKRTGIVVGVLLLGTAGAVFTATRTQYKNPIPAARLKSAAPAPDQRPAVWDAPAFAYVDQDERPVSSRSLRGKVWVADFIFTNCGNTCPIMTAKMVALQKQITDPRVTFISFSVDPDRDKPANLKAYAAKYGVDESRWRFLAPPSSKSIRDVAAAMRIAGPPTENNSPILHADRFLLIDQHGKVRGSYYSGDVAAMDRLATDAVALARFQDARAD